MCYAATRKAKGKVSRSSDEVGINCHGSVISTEGEKVRGRVYKQHQAKNCSRGKAWCYCYAKAIYQPNIRPFTGITPPVAPDSGLSTSCDTLSRCSATALKKVINGYSFATCQTLEIAALPSFPPDVAGEHPHLRESNPQLCSMNAEDMP